MIPFPLLVVEANQARPLPSAVKAVFVAVRRSLERYRQLPDHRLQDGSVLQGDFPINITSVARRRTMVSYAIINFKSLNSLFRAVHFGLPLC